MYGSGRKGEQERREYLAGRCRRGDGGDLESDATRVRVLEGDRESGGGLWWKDLHHRVGGRARTQGKAIPKARAGQGEMSNVLSARVLRRHEARVTLLRPPAADDFRLLYGIDFTMS